ncbi:secretin N-terminal domain-containing protein [Acidobacteriota bacterium]
MKKITILFLFVLLLFGTLPIQADSSSSSIQKEKDVQLSLRTEIVKVKYIRPSQARNVLRVYLSRNGDIIFDDNLQILTIRDEDAIVEKMLQVLKQIDIKPVDIMFTVDLVLGGSDESIEGGSVKSDPLIRELSKVLKYAVYKRLDSTVIRVQENRHHEQRIGKGNISLVLSLRPRYIKEDSDEILQVEIHLVHDRRLPQAAKESGRISLLSTSLSMKSGERQVVGVSKLDGGDDALILILSGKVIK